MMIETTLYDAGVAQTLYGSCLLDADGNRLLTGATGRIVTGGSGTGSTNVPVAYETDQWSITLTSAEITGKPYFVVVIDHASALAPIVFRVRVKKIKKWHVDASAADDTGLGTAEEPLQTIDTAKGRASIGETIIIKAGTYDAHTADKAGITYRAMPGAEVVDATAASKAFTITANNVTVHGLVADGANAGFYADDVEYLTLVNCNGVGGADGFYLQDCLCPQLINCVGESEYDAIQLRGSQAFLVDGGTFTTDGSDEIGECRSFACVASALGIVRNASFVSARTADLDTTLSVVSISNDYGATTRLSSILFDNCKFRGSNSQGSGDLVGILLDSTNGGNCEVRGGSIELSNSGDGDTYDYDGGTHATSLLVATGVYRTGAVLNADNVREFDFDPDVDQVDLVDAPNATAINALATAIEAAIVNEGDATAVLQAMADKLASDLEVGDLTAQAIASAVWQSLTASMTTADSVGKALAELLAALTPTRAAKLDNADVPTSTRGTSTLDGPGVQSAMDSQGYTAARGARLDNVDATVSSRSTLDAAGVRAAMESQGYTSDRAAQLDDVSTGGPVGNTNPGKLWFEVSRRADLTFEVTRPLTVVAGQEKFTIGIRFGPLVGDTWLYGVYGATSSEPTQLAVAAEVNRTDVLVQVDPTNAEAGETYTFTAEVSPVFGQKFLLKMTVNAKSGT